MTRPQSARRKRDLANPATRKLFPTGNAPGVTIARRWNLAGRALPTTGRASLARPFQIPSFLPFLILLAGATRAPAAGETIRTHELLQRWSQAYGLKARLPPRRISLESIPQAPHLQRCWKRAELQQELETRGPQGEAPSWSLPQPDCPSCVPNTPWVQGSNDDNLPGTHLAQRDIWLSQFPAGDCRSQRLLVVMWPAGRIFGVGAQLHLMSAALDLAMEYNRTLVAYPRSYARANHAGCEEFGEALDFACYFTRFTSRGCEAFAREALRNERRDTVRAEGTSLRPLLAGDAQVVVTGPSYGWSLHYLEAYGATKRWGQPWLRSGDLQWAVVRPYGDKQWQSQMLKSHWWRSQAVRFFLRWPSAYLCHLENRARHSTYGALMARGIARSLREQERIKARVEEAASAGGDSSTPGWRASPDLELVSQPQRGAIQFGEQEERYMFREPRMPRPILSVHVRQGDKGIEQRLFSFGAFMFQAAKMRMYEPYLNNVWLSTEMQSVVDAVKQYPSWRFFFTNNTRQELGTREYEYEEQGGLEEVIGASFANLLISAQCDSFVSMLNSNWNRLIHELRSTNGRAHAMLLSLNHGRW